MSSQTEQPVCTHYENHKILFRVGPFGVTDVLSEESITPSGGAVLVLCRAIKIEPALPLHSPPSSSLSQTQMQQQQKITQPTFLIKALLGNTTTATRSAIHARMRHEFAVLKELETHHHHHHDVEGVIRPVELITTAERGLVLVLQDQGGQTLRQLITTGSTASIINKERYGDHHQPHQKEKKRARRRKKKKKKKNLKRFFMIAIGIVEVLKRLHERGFVHRDIKPESIKVLFLPWEKDKGEGGEEVKVELLNFGICQQQYRIPHVERVKEEEREASEVEKREDSEEEEKEEEEKREGTWAYMSPEQTGRTKKRLVDHRTDFYSFGWYRHHLFFQLLCSRKLIVLFC